VQSFTRGFATKALNAILLVFGNEVHGVTEAVALCDGCIEMQLGTKHSLNIFCQCRDRSLGFISENQLVKIII
jgi:hypothetical protein